MPIYEYQCSQCGEKFEVRQSIGDDGAKLNCPKCSSSNPQRLVSPFFSPGSNKAESSATSCPTCSSGVCGLPPME